MNPSQSIRKRYQNLCLNQAVRDPATDAEAYPHRKQVYAHKGSAGLMPENTLPAYKASLNLGVDVLDADLSVTKDKVIVISHNQALNPDITRQKNSAGQLEYITDSVLIKDLTYAQLQNYAVGSTNPNTTYAKSFPAQRQLNGVPIPKLSDAIELLQQPPYQNVRFNVEIKYDIGSPNDTFPPDEVAVLLLQELEKYDFLERVEIQSFIWTALREVGKLAPQVTRGFLSDPGNSSWLSYFEKHFSPNQKVTLNNYADLMTSTIKSLESEGISIWEPYYGSYNYIGTSITPALTKEMVDLAHARGLPVVCWTLFDYDTVPPAYYPYIESLSKSTQFVLHLGVDGFLTNRPDIARGILAAYGYGLPPVPILLE